MKNLLDGSVEAKLKDGSGLEGSGASGQSPPIRFLVSVEIPVIANYAL